MCLETNFHGAQTSEQIPFAPKRPEVIKKQVDRTPKCHPTYDHKALFDHRPYVGWQESARQDSERSTNRQEEKADEKVALALGHQKPKVYIRLAGTVAKMVANRARKRWKAFRELRGIANAHRKNVSVGRPFLGQKNNELVHLLHKVAFPARSIKSIEELCRIVNPDLDETVFLNGPHRLVGINLLYLGTRMLRVHNHRL